MYFIFIALNLVLFFSCSCNNNNERHLNNVASPIKKVELIPFTFKLSDTLNIAEYSSWIKNQEGYLYSHKENEYVEIDILYKPIEFEAAISTIGDLNDENFKKSLKLKNGFHHILVQCREKNSSLSKPSLERKEIIEQVKKQLHIFQNKTDYLSYSIIEAFPAKILNQPNQIIVLVPQDSAFQNLSISIDGSQWNLSDVKIEINEKLLRSFPKLKI